MSRAEMPTTDLNRASQRELTQLPRIGADMARRIVRYRVLRRGFRDWADFAQIPGLSEAALAAIRVRAWIGPIPANGFPAGDRRRTGRYTGSQAAATAGFRRRARGPAGAGRRTGRR